MKKLHGFCNNKRVIMERTLLWWRRGTVLSMIVSWCLFYHDWSLVSLYRYLWLFYILYQTFTLHLLSKHWLKCFHRTTYQKLSSIKRWDWMLGQILIVYFFHRLNHFIYLVLYTIYFAFCICIQNIFSISKNPDDVTMTPNIPAPCPSGTFVTCRLSLNTFPVISTSLLAA